ncbi:unnamed protein product [Discosporangium mesarthrocarpum]
MTTMGLAMFLSDVEMLEVINSLPEVEFAFGYGSGVMEQEGYDQPLSGARDFPMLDLVLAVRNSREWHQKNLERRVAMISNGLRNLNRDHYSTFARLVGPGGIAWVQEGFGAKAGLFWTCFTSGIYYNTMVPLTSTSHHGRLMKYGVISLDDLKTDLTEWTWLYTAGRLHKPVRIVRGEDGEIMPYARENLANAVRVALLLLPEAFNSQELFTTIAGLSYTGDIRMGLGEDQNKVQNIVTKAFGKFQDLYSPTLKGFMGLSTAGHGSTSYWQDSSPGAREKLAQALPLALKERLMAPTGMGWGQRPANLGYAGAIGNRACMADQVSCVLRAVVSRSSRWQTAKGLFTAGVAKSAVYAASKMMKATAARRIQREEL